MGTRLAEGVNHILVAGVKFSGSVMLCDLCFVITICKRFMFNPQIIKSVMEQNNEEPGSKYSLVAMETTEKLQRICSNVVGYCKTVMNSAGEWIRLLDFCNKDGNKKFKCYSVVGYYF